MSKAVFREGKAADAAQTCSAKRSRLKTRTSIKMPHAMLRSERQPNTTGSVISHLVLQHQSTAGAEQCVLHHSPHYTSAVPSAGPPGAAG